MSTVAHRYGFSSGILNTALRFNFNTESTKKFVAIYQWKKTRNINLLDHPGETINFTK